MCDPSSLAMITPELIDFPSIPATPVISAVASPILELWATSFCDARVSELFIGATMYPNDLAEVWRD